MSEYEEKTIRLMIQEGGRLLSEIERLQAENEKLRERVHELEIEYDGATTAVLEKTERIEWIAGRLRGETNENERMRELVRCLVNAEHPSDRATLIANAADMLAELGVEVDA